MKCDCRAHGSFLTAKGLGETAQQISLEGLAPRGVREYIDRVGSVSALVEVEENFVFDDQLLDEQDRRFHNGS